MQVISYYLDITVEVMAIILCVCAVSLSFRNVRSKFCFWKLLKTFLFKLLSLAWSPSNTNEILKE